MDKKTINQLNKLNTEFYLKTQVYFNRTRQFYWAGWQKLLPHLKKQIKLLDVGCGNGRLGKFLKENNLKIEYTGMDNNQYLLDEAKKDLPKAKLINQDIYQEWKLKDKFEAIAILGVIHHVPGVENRIEMLKRAKKQLKPGGLLILSIWQFKNVERLKKKIVKNHGLKGLEKNDYILKWEKGVKAQRYCHFIDNQEIKRILGQLKMKLVDEFESDAKEGIGNKYIILKLED